MDGLPIRPPTCRANGRIGNPSYTEDKATLIVEQFSISCTTCRARLQVRDESVIGQILACPKCSSMVKVEAPNGYATGHSSATVGKSASTGGNDLDDSGELFSDASPVEESAAQAVPPQVTHSSVHHDSDKAILPSGDWTSESTRRWKSLVSYGIAGVGGLIAAIVLIVLASGGPNTSVADLTTDGTTVEDNKPIEEPQTKVEPKNDSAAKQANTDDKNPESSNTTGSKQADVPQVADKIDDPPKPIGKKPVDDEVPASDTPPGLDPGEPLNGKDSKSDDSDSLLKSLNEFGEFLDDAPFEAADPKRSAEDGDDTARPPVSLPRPPVRKIDAARRLDDSIPAIEFPGVSLVDLLDFVSEFSSIPITIDPEALVHRRVTPAQSVSVKLIDTTVADVLMTALSPLDLGYEMMGNHLIVTRKPLESGELRELTYPVDDLAGDAAEVEQLKKLLISLIKPNSWQGVAGTGSVRTVEKTLVVRHDDEAHFQALLLFEKLRIARGRPKRSKFPQQMFELPIRSQRAKESMTATVSLNYVLPTRFVEILNRVAAETKTQILIDWQALAEKAWNPQAETTFLADKETLGDALMNMLEPMELTYRVVDETTIQVTTNKAILDKPELEMHPIGDLFTAKLDAAALVAQLEHDLAALKLATQPGQLQYDPKSKCLISMASQTHQNEIAKMLARRRAE